MQHDRSVLLESFDFKEFADAPVHEYYLWGTVSSLTGLPLHGYRQHGDPEVKPGAEVLLIDEAVWKILAEGLMPLVWSKGRDEARLRRFQSIADSARGIAGRWR